MHKIEISPEMALEQMQAMNTRQRRMRPMAKPLAKAPPRTRTGGESLGTPADRSSKRGRNMTEAEGDEDIDEEMQAALQLSIAMTVGMHNDEEGLDSGPEDL